MRRQYLENWIVLSSVSEKSRIDFWEMFEDASVQGTNKFTADSVVIKTTDNQTLITWRKSEKHNDGVQFYNETDWLHERTEEQYPNYCYHYDKWCFVLTSDNVPY